MKRIICVILAFVFAFGMSSYINNLAAVTNPGSVPVAATQEAAPAALSPLTAEEPAPVEERTKMYLLNLSRKLRLKAPIPVTSSTR